MKKAIDILYTARQQSIGVLSNGDDINLRIPKGKAIDKELLQQIKNNKADLIATLKNNSRQPAKGDRSIAAYNRNQVEFAPLSFSQERLWFIHQLEGSQIYHLNTRLLLTGNLNIEALSFALKSIVQRHEVLRSIILENNGKPYHQVIPADNLQLEIVDEAGLMEESIALNELIGTLAGRPFNLACDYLRRALLVTMGNKKHLMDLTTHHIASDAWSLPIMVKEVTELYNQFLKGNTQLLPPLPIQIADYAIWEKESLTKEVLETKLDYWRNKLQGVATLQLPTDFAGLRTYLARKIRSYKGKIFKVLALDCNNTLWKGICGEAGG